MRIPVFLFLLAACTSCGVYLPNVMPVPMMQEKGELCLSGYTGFTGREARVSYSFTRRLGVLASYKDITGKKQKYDSRFAEEAYDQGFHSFKEVGIGTFRPRTDSADGKVRELFLLAGQGTTSFHKHWKDSLDLARDRYRECSYQRVSVQANFGRKAKRFSYAFSPRLAYVHYYGITDQFGKVFYPEQNNSFLYLEGAITGRWQPWKFLSLQLQESLTLPLVDLSAHKSGYFKDFGPINISLGLNLHLGVWQEKK
jgi:hypothetical protein